MDVSMAPIGSQCGLSRKDIERASERISRAHVEPAGGLLGPLEALLATLDTDWLLWGSDDGEPMVNGEAGSCENM